MTRSMLRSLNVMLFDLVVADSFSLVSVSLARSIEALRLSVVPDDPHGELTMSLSSSVSSFVSLFELTDLFVRLFFFLRFVDFLKPGSSGVSSLTEIDNRLAFLLDFGSS